MANPAVTNTFVASTTADANQINTNFNDIVDSLTDGTKSLTIDEMSATVATSKSYMTLSGSDLATTSVPVSNVVYPNNHIKAWGRLTINTGGSTTVEAGFNVASATWASSTITVTYHNSMTSGGYCVIPGRLETLFEWNFTVHATSANTNTLVLNQYGKAATAAAWVAGGECHFIALGRN